MAGFESALTKRITLVAVLAAVFGFSCDGFFVDPQVVQITINPATPSLLAGGTMQFTAVALYDDGSQKALSQAVWSTSNATVVFVSDKGLATALGEGSATVSASSDLASGSTAVSVVNSPITSLVLSPINPSISMSQLTQQFSATAIFGDGTSRDISSSVTWTSSNTSVATVSSTGLATAVKAGTTIIQAAAGTENASTTLTVLP